MTRLSAASTLMDNKPLPDGCDYLHLETGLRVDTLIGIQQPSPDGNLYKLDSIPYFTGDYHLWDIVRVEWRWAEPPLVTEVIKPSGFKTLRVGFYRFGDYIVNSPLDPEQYWATHPIHGEWAALGLSTGERWWWGNQVQGVVFAVPASYNPTKIELLRQRHDDLLIELV